jgi:proline iminopeptidase
MKEKIFTKELPFEKRGNGRIPLLIVGPASLFKKNGLLPKELYEHFTVYFVDLFLADSASSTDYSKLTLASFVEVIEQIRIQLKIEKMVLFAHSANGILAIEYANKYSERVYFNILVGTMPIWGNYRKNLTRNFFRGNASEIRKKINDNQKITQNSEHSSPSETFKAQYKDRKALFFEDDNLIHSSPAIDNLWDNVTLDSDLVNRYFAVIADYDLRLSDYKPIPTFIALGIYDASCPFYAWTEDIKEWFTKKHLPFEDVIKLYIFDSDHYLMSPAFYNAKPVLFIEKLLEYLPSLIPESHYILRAATI